MIGIRDKLITAGRLYRCRGCVTTIYTKIKERNCQVRREVMHIYKRRTVKGEEVYETRTRSLEESEGWKRRESRFPPLGRLGNGFPIW
jgi:hypothetical protein